jgi:hypothetical protein
MLIVRAGCGDDTSCGWVNADLCNGNPELLWNPATQKCYNAARHPSDINCAWNWQQFNQTSGDCFWPDEPIYCPPCMLWDPVTVKCYQPNTHPNDFNCKSCSLGLFTFLTRAVGALLGQYYDSGNNTCCDSLPVSPASACALT